MDTLIEGNLKSDKIIVFVHGFGTNKDEGFNLFRDIAKELKKNFQVVRFDFSSYGKSEGRQEDANISKHAKDLKAVLNYVRNKYKSNIYIIAHSRGTSAVCLLNPSGIKKVIFSGIPSPDSKNAVKNLIKRIEGRKGKVNMKGITLYRRTSGEIQKLGSKFWKDFINFNTISELKKFSKKSDITIIHPQNDEVVGSKGMEKYKKLPGIKYLKIPGNHNFTKSFDRKNLIKIIKKTIL